MFADVLTVDGEIVHCGTYSEGGCFDGCDKVNSVRATFQSGCMFVD